MLSLATMYKNQKILALIPARGGSKGIPGKNIKKLCGLPLIAYTINAAKKSKYIDEIVVTTDSEKIAKVAREYGASVPFLRPAKISGDDAKTIDAVIHAINELGTDNFDVLILLQPTQPLRTSEDIDGAIELFFSKKCRSLIGVCKTASHPLFVRTVDKDNVLNKLLVTANSTIRRQDLPDYYVINGAIYINKISDLTHDTSFGDNEIGYIMEKENSVDIDDMLDFYFAETILVKKICAKVKVGD